MPDMLYTFAYSTLEFINYLLGYLIIFQLKTTKRRVIITYALFIIVQMVVYCLFGVKNMESLALITPMLITIFAISSTGKKREKHLLYPIIVMTLTITSILTTFVISLIVHIPEREILENHEMVIACEMVPIVLMVVYWMYQKTFNKEQYEMGIEIKKNQYILLYIGIGSSFVLIAFAQMLSQSADLPVVERNLYGLAVSGICLVFVLMSLWQGIIVARETRYRQQNEVYEQYIKMQNEQIRSVIENDQKMRRYKHDMKAHFTVMKAYCDKNDSEELKDYFNEIVEKSALYEARSYTGNVAVDAVIENYMIEAERENIKVDYQCNISEDICISNFDLCTVVSNLFKNAIEANLRVDEIDRRIHFIITQFEKSVCIEFVNTNHEQVVFENNMPITRKQDKLNHGIGSKNVRDIVDKNKGSIEYENVDGRFKVNIIM